MTPTTKRILGGAAAGLALAVVAPLAPASAHGTWGAESGRHGWHSSSNPAERTARHTLRAALTKAARDFRMAARQAEDTFRNDPVVVQALADKRAVVETSTDPALILAAWNAYDAAVAGPRATLQATIDAARATYEAAVDAAYTAYDTATVSADEAAARAAFRLAVRDAAHTYRAAVATAVADFRTATAPARAQLRASVNAALQTYLASGRTATDQQAFQDAVDAARSVYANDPTVAAAKAARHTALATARSAYRDALRAARLAFFQATGHLPRGVILEGHGRGIGYGAYGLASRI